MSVRETSVMSGRCVPPANGSLRTKTSVREGLCSITAATASGIAPRWTGMCSAWATIRPRSSKRAVEQSRRSLMFAENAERINAAPISSATARSACPSTWSSIVTISSRLRHPPHGTIPNPHPPGGNPAGGAVELDQGRAARFCSRARGKREGRTGRDLRGSNGDQLQLAAAVRVAVALLVEPVETLLEARAERHSELEGLTVIAEIRLALCRQLSHLAQRPHLAPDVIASLVADCEAERGEHPGGLRYEHGLDPKVVGEIAGVKGPRAAERNQREVAWIPTTLDRNDAQRAEHLRVDDADHVGWVEAGQCPLSCGGVELEAVRERRRKPAEQQVRVGDGRPPAATPVTGRAGIGARALWADAERAAGVDPCERSASGANGVHVDAREPDRQARNRSLGRALGHATADQADVGRRPAHVEREGILEPSRGRDPRRADDAAGRSREQSPRRVRRHLVDRGHSSG